MTYRPDPDFDNHHAYPPDLPPERDPFLWIGSVSVNYRWVFIATDDGEFDREYPSEVAARLAAEHLRQLIRAGVRVENSRRGAEYFLRDFGRCRLPHGRFAYFGPQS